ncbi:MAG: tetratricopeptide repeat protein [Thermodesulfobacteriaceae bacterium]|nr:tetratricopeptide repeat protein [Thermodesulfobacteriaceae bacterium]MCX8041018.1 tetratricopeptide repeat protein [Thermodesulfobacteriaceae bacterium]MDW8135257.1 tetratricopeptide repeat protein [Thermodesulfobacterium sp.]
MSKFYEILKKLKEPKEKKPKKLLLKRLIYLFIGIIFLSGIGISFLEYYIKKKFLLRDYGGSNNQNNNQKFIFPNQTTVFSNSIPPISTKVTNPTEISSTPPLVKGNFSSLSKKRASFTSHSFPSAHNLTSFSEKKDHSEKTDFLLNREDLLNSLLILAEEERKRGNLEKAILYYQSYLKEKENPWVMNNYGACLTELGRFDEAINLFNKALSLKKDPEIKYNLVIAYLKKGEKEKACKELKNLTFNSPLEEKLKKLKELCK